MIKKRLGLFVAWNLRWQNSFEAAVRKCRFEIQHQSFNWHARCQLNLKTFTFQKSLFKTSYEQTQPFYSLECKFGADDNLRRRKSSTLHYFPTAFSDQTSNCSLKIIISWAIYCWNWKTPFITRWFSVSSFTSFIWKVFRKSRKVKNCMKCALFYEKSLIISDSQLHLCNL